MTQYDKGKLCSPVKVTEIPNMNYLTYHLMDCFYALKGRKEGFKSIELVSLKEQRINFEIWSKGAGIESKRTK